MIIRDHVSRPNKSPCDQGFLIAGQDSHLRRARSRNRDNSDDVMSRCHTPKERVGEQDISRNLVDG